MMKVYVDNKLNMEIKPEDFDLIFKLQRNLRVHGRESSIEYSDNKETRIVTQPMNRWLYGRG
jgi:hypothetical protein